VGEHTAFVVQEPAKRKQAVGEKQMAKEEKKPMKVIKVDLDSLDKEEQPVRRTATAEAVGATAQEEIDLIEKDENMQTPNRVIHTPAKEAHGEVETCRGSPIHATHYKVAMYLKR
jgi:hypothetical protein